MDTHTDERWLRQAIALSEQAKAAGDEPFGSLLVGPGDRLLAEALNTVTTDRDVSAHPELKLAVWAGRHLDPETARATTLYTSCENCAMCSTAFVWAGLGTLVYAMAGGTLAALRPGTTWVDLSARDLFARASYPVTVRGPLLEQESLAVQEGYWD